MLRVDIYSYDDPHKTEPEINIWFTYRKGDKAVEIHSLRDDLALVSNIKEIGIKGSFGKWFKLEDGEKFLEELRFEFSGSYVRASEVYRV